MKAVHILVKKTCTKHEGLSMVAGIHCIPCECGKIYIGQTGRTVESRRKEHTHIRVKQPEKSAVAERSIDTAHRIDFNGTSKLCTAMR
jgi:hypothetical protein